tara:strand:+ start:47 stop:949 length:903 start_codon:yes stop_codon:yes gene_type:complete
MARIDSHLHVFAKVSSEFPRQPTPVCPPEREETAEKLLENMAAHNIDQAMLVQYGGTSIEHHAYLRHCLRTYPDRFLGIGLIPPDCTEPEEHMDRLAAKGGIVGFRLRTLGGPRDPFAPIEVREFTAYRIWKHAAERDYVLWLYLKAADAYLCAYLVDAFPQVRVVFNHMGACPGEGKFSWDEKGRPHIRKHDFYTTQHTIYRLSRYENVMLHLSGQYALSTEPFPYRDMEHLHRFLHFSFGAGRLLWASDAPWIYEEPGYGAYTALIEKLLPDLSAEEYADIMGATAQRFLRFPQRAAG